MHQVLGIVFPHFGVEWTATIGCEQALQHDRHVSIYMYIQCPHVTLINEGSKERLDSRILVLFTVQLVSI